MTVIIDCNVVHYDIGPLTTNCTAKYHSNFGRSTIQHHMWFIIESWSHCIGKDQCQQSNHV